MAQLSLGQLCRALNPPARFEGRTIRGIQIGAAGASRILCLGIWRQNSNEGWQIQIIQNPNRVHLKLLRSSGFSGLAWGLITSQLRRAAISTCLGPVVSATCAILEH